MNQEERVRDIWGEGVKNHCGKAKLSLLCYLDEMLPQAKNGEEKDRLGRVKARIHNELSQLSLDIRILLRLKDAGGDISPFEEEIVRKSTEGGSKAGRVRRAFNNLPNPVIKKAEGEV